MGVAIDTTALTKTQTQEGEKGSFNEAPAPVRLLHLVEKGLPILQVSPGDLVCCKSGKLSTLREFDGSEEEMFGLNHGPIEYFRFEIPGADISSAMLVPALPSPLEIPQEQMALC